MQEEIKRMLKLWNACYRLMRILLSCLLLSGKRNIKIQRNTLLLVLCGHETWRFTLICEDIPRLFENRVLREIMGAKREKLRGEWRTVYNEELHNLQPS